MFWMRRALLLRPSSSRCARCLALRRSAPHSSCDFLESEKWIMICSFCPSRTTLPDNFVSAGAATANLAYAGHLAYLTQLAHLGTEGPRSPAVGPTLRSRTSSREFFFEAAVEGSWRPAMGWLSRDGLLARPETHSLCKDIGLVVPQWATSPSRDI